MGVLLLKTDKKGKRQKRDLSNVIDDCIITKSMSAYFADIMMETIDANKKDDFLFAGSVPYGDSY